MSEEQALVPRLRFPEFRDAGEWQGRPLSKFIESLDAGVSVNSGDRPATVNEKGILKTSAVTDGVFDPLENKVVVDAGEMSRLKEPVVKNTIIISRMNTPALVGANAYIEDDYENLFLPDRLWAAKPKPNTCMRFIAYILGSGKGRLALSELATGTSGSMKNIAKANVLELPVVTPSPEEQQKIADCLSSLDALIAAQASKVDALKAQKNGLMQQLFPREGETAPRLRFPEFQEGEEWNLKRLEAVFIENARAFSMADEGDYELVTVKRRYGGVVSRGIFKGKSIKVKTQFTLKEDDFLISKRQIVHCACGVVPASLSGSIVSNEYSVLRAREGFDISFLAYFAQQPNVSRSFLECSIGIVIEKMLFKLNDWLKREFLFPSFTEQKKIANCLTSLDTLITAHTEKLDALKTHKKGLMQQLFPNPGAVRV